MGTRVPFVAIAAALVIVAGCVSTSGLSGDDGDGSIPPNDDGGSDTGNSAAYESGFPDVAKVLDGAPSGNDYCSKLSPAPMLCDDFDVPDGGIPWMVGTTNGTQDIDTEASTSPPQSIEFVTAANAGNPKSWREFTLFANPSAVDIEFDVRVDIHDDAGRLSVARFEFNGASSSFIAQFTILPTSTIFTEQLTTTTDHPGPAFPFQSWIHVSMVLNFGSTPTADVSFVAASGGTSATVYKGSMAGPIMNIATVRHLFGAPYVEATVASWTLHLDNVVIRETP